LFTLFFKKSGVLVSRGAMIPRTPLGFLIVRESDSWGIGGTAELAVAVGGSVTEVPPQV
jgi:hypothetical protein